MYRAEDSIRLIRRRIRHFGSCSLFPWHPSFLSFYRYTTHSRPPTPSAASSKTAGGGFCLVGSEGKRKGEKEEGGRHFFDDQAKTCRGREERGEEAA